MEFVARSGKPFFNLLVDQDDAVHEYAYLTRVEQALATAAKLALIVNEPAHL